MTVPTEEFAPDRQFNVCGKCGLTRPMWSGANWCDSCLELLAEDNSITEEAWHEMSALLGPLRR